MIPDSQEVYTRANGSRGVRTKSGGEDMARQEFVKDCDVNHIMDKFLKTGTITHVRREPGYYLNMVDMPDYRESLQTVIDAQNSFMELDAKVRLKFDNDPAKFIEFLADPKNNDEAVALGLKVKQQIDPVLNELKEINQALQPTTPEPPPKAKAKK